MTTQNTPVDSVEDLGSEDTDIASRWLTEISLAEKENEKWFKKSRKVLERYRDERNQTESDETRFNVLWSNVQTLFPACYARPPKAVVTRRFNDADPVARAASLILQRAIQFDLDCTDTHQQVRSAVFDFLLVARGTTWERYEPHFRQMQQPETTVAAGGQDDGLMVSTGDEQQEIDYEESVTDYIHWTDFFHSPARVWQEVRWCGRKVLMTRDDGIDRFGDVFKDVPLGWKPDGLGDNDKLGPAFEMFSRAEVYEIWNKDDRKVYWIAKGYGDAPLDVKDDPLGLENFFPCPKPLFGTITNDTLVPVPDYVQYQDQAMQLDDLTDRVSVLTKAIKNVGVYDASVGPAVERIFQEGVENKLIPVNNWGTFAQKGGLDGCIQLLPIESMAKVLEQLMSVRQQAKQDLYEVTGMADVIRGSSDPNETATAQEIKGRFAGMRLTDRQQEVARFVRDVLRIKGEIICKHFSAKTLIECSDYMQSLGANPQIGMKAIQLLKDNHVRAFRVDIEDASTIAIDEQQEKRDRSELLQAVSQFMQQVYPVAAQQPALAPLVGQLLLFGVRAFKVGRELETSFEDAIEQMTKMAKQAEGQPPPPNPEMIKAQIAQATLQQKTQQMQQSHADNQADLQFRHMEMIQKQHETAQEDAIKMAELKQNQQSSTTQDALDRARLELDRQKQEIEARELALKEREAGADHLTELAGLHAEHARGTAELASKHFLGVHDLRIKEKVANKPTPKPAAK